MRVDGPFRRGPVLVVAAHPDDETIGAGGHLPLLEGVAIVHVTDGAPRNNRDAAAAGFADWRDYARARRQELLRALELAGIPADKAQELGCADQEASFALGPLALRLAGVMARARPRVVLTHAYEGGHPDHDATAFAVWAACRRLAEPPERWEFTSYHARGGAVACGEFLPAPGVKETRARLSAGARDLKQRMFHCFATQQQVLAPFGVDEERFRPAPVYDFTAPPHAGPLYYERFDWGVSSTEWRRLAREALDELRHSREAAERRRPARA